MSLVLSCLCTTVYRLWNQIFYEFKERYNCIDKTSASSSGCESIRALLEQSMFRYLNASSRTVIVLHVH